MDCLSSREVHNGVSDATKGGLVEVVTGEAGRGGGYLTAELGNQGC